MNFSDETKESQLIIPNELTAREQNLKDLLYIEELTDEEAASVAGGLNPGILAKLKFKDIDEVRKKLPFLFEPKPIGGIRPQPYIAV